jgi:nitroimidazol reductase NimA-like FMN-containing flavoprotein (pyridoxamine 5'-phosphate oxidase superfamily)
MKYHLRRAEREIKDNSIIEEILRTGKYAIIALCRNNEPYAVTLSYGYDAENKALYFHSAKSGLKMDFVKSNPEACLTILQDKGYIQNECAHSYRSVIIRGLMELVENESEKRKGIEIMINQLENNPDIMKSRLNAKKEIYDNMQVIKLKIREVTGKEGR